MNQYFCEKISDILEYRNTVVVSNNITGKWIRIPKECYVAIKYSIDKNISVYDTIDMFLDDDKVYYKNILKNLDNLGVLEETVLEELRGYFIPKVVFSITNRCNLNCEYCCNDSSLKKDEILDLKDLKSIVDNIIKFSPQNLVITGGEPLIRNDFEEFIDYTKSKFNGKLILSTNATLINEMNIEHIVKNFYAIEISLDGYDEDTCSKVRGKGVFNKVVKVIKMLKDMNFNRIGLSMVVGKYNYNLKSKFENLNHDLGTKMSIRYFCGLGRGSKGCDKYLEKGTLFYTPNDAYENDEDIISFYCNAGNSQLFVNNDGNLFLCPNLTSDEFKICNMKELDDSIIDKIYRQGFKAFNNFNKLKPKNIESCKNCSINLFCNVCPAKTFLIKDDSIAFEKNCELHKKKIFPKVWK